MATNKRKFKHNKKRNTAFLYEALLQELTKAVVGKQSKRQAVVVGIIKEHFSPKTVLGSELGLYRSLYETQGMDAKDAERLVVEVRRQHERKVDPKILFKEQSSLIKKINMTLSSGVYANFVPNYKDFATIAQMFSDKTSAKESILLEKQIVANISSSEEEEVRLQPIDNLTYKTFVEKFNEQYDGVLYEEQKDLLMRFIFSFSDNAVALKTYLNEEVGRLRSVIKESLNLNEIKADSQMRVNTEKVLDILDSFRERRVDRKYLSEVMKIQQLAREVQE